MDIAFHYFAVKALAVRAGFEEDDAQFIAEYSQMVDNFDYTMYWQCMNIPAYVKQAGFDILFNETLGLVNPVQTGFLADGHFINIDYALFILPRFQRLTCAPFHFIYHDRSKIGTTNYRTYPAVMDDLSLIWNMMKAARNDYRAAQEGATGIYGDNRVFKRKTLMKIGMLLHIFADTTAHQLFSGFNDEVNNVDLLFVKNNITEGDETEEYRSMILDFLKQFKIAPKIGHMLIEHIPDLTHLSFGMRYTESGVKSDYTRSNTADFIMRSEQIIRYLFSCREQNMMDDNEWRAYSERLSRCFLTDISKCKDEKSMVNVLKRVWTEEFGGIFDFDCEKIKNGYVLKTEPLTNDALMQLRDIPELYRPNILTYASEDFYLFNVCAEEVLVNLYGDNPRRLIGDEEMFPNINRTTP